MVAHQKITPLSDSLGDAIRHRVDANHHTRALSIGATDLPSTVVITLLKAQRSCAFKYTGYIFVT